jgi:hypothetical protein
MKMRMRPLDGVGESLRSLSVALKQLGRTKRLHARLFVLHTVQAQGSATCFALPFYAARREELETWWSWRSAWKKLWTHLVKEYSGLESCALSVRTGKKQHKFPIFSASLLFVFSISLDSLLLSHASSCSFLLLIVGR